MLNKIKDKLTILYLKLLFGNFEGKTRYRYKNHKQDVYLFSNKSIKGSHSTPFKTILIQDSLFKKYSKNVRDYVFLHELGHINVNYFLTLLYYVLVIPTFYVFFTIIPFTVLMPLLLWFLKRQIYLSIIAFSSFLILFFIISFFLVILNWISEGYAEIFAIKIIGEKKYISSLQEMKKKAKKSNILKKYFYFIRYPPKTLVLWVYRKLIKSA